MGTVRDGCKLVVVVDARPGEAALSQLAAALEAGDAASVILVLPAGAPVNTAALRSLVETAQSRGAAALVHGDAHLAQTLKADGVHLPWSEDVADRLHEVREMLGTRCIVGAEAGSSRHDAMTLGEGGADYVAFNMPPQAGDLEAARAARLDIVAWWSEIFEVPGVALDVSDTDEAGRLADAGADFVAVRVAPSDTAAGARDRVAAYSAAIAAPAQA